MSQGQSRGLSLTLAVGAVLVLLVPAEVTRLKAKCLAP